MRQEVRNFADQLDHAVEDRLDQRDINDLTGRLRVHLEILEGRRDYNWIPIPQGQR